MEFHYNAIQKWMKVQQKVWLFIYPVSALGGCMVGGMVGSGEPFNKIIQQPVMIISSLIAIAFSIPFGNYLTKQMFRKGFRQYTMQLEGNIRALKGENVG